MKVGNIFRKYRNQNRIGLFGYGAAQKNTDQVSFFFPLNFNYSDPYVNNFEEVFKGYNEALERLTLAGPSLLRMTFEKVVDYTQRLYSLNQMNYVIFILFTDGGIDDLTETIDVIVKGSKLPLSILIIGLGNEDFSKMNILDADEVPLKSTSGEVMMRDIV